MAFRPHRFGRYVIVDPIAVGGMAEIYRARLSSIGGSGRIIVIKKIHSDFGGNKEYQQMFQSEIQVTMGFSHPNIVQVYDFGDEDQQPFIAMEYVDGKNLRQLITSSKTRKQRLPLDLAVSIIEQSASGLHYAHTYKDKITGEPYHIIHRDVSPQNIIISYDGTVKVIDFGIAKANVNSDKTRAGVIKGKPSYLSPEQVTGEELDHRSDIFSLGIVLWELLTGIKLFKAKNNENEFVVLKLIESCNSSVKKPSFYNPQVPPELDEIVMRSLAKKRDDRFRSAEEFRRALRQFLAKIGSHVGSSELSYHLKKLFKDDIVEDRKKLQENYKRAEDLLKKDKEGEAPPIEVKEVTELSDAISIVQNTPSPPPLRKGESQIKEDRSRSSTFAQEKREQTGSGIISLTSEASYRKAPVRRFGLSGGNSASMIRQAALVLVVLGLGAGLFFGDQINSMFHGSEMAEDPNALINQKADKMAEKMIGDANKTRKPAKQVKDKIRIKFRIYPEWGAKPVIFADGKKLNPDSPEIEVPFDYQFQLQIQKLGFKNFEKTHYFPQSRYQSFEEKEEDVLLEPVSYGYLTIHVSPTSAEVVIVPLNEEENEIFDGSKEVSWSQTSPVEYLKLPVGKYKVNLTNRLLGAEESVIVQVDENKEVRHDVTLKVKR